MIQDDYKTEVAAYVREALRRAFAESSIKTIGQLALRTGLNRRMLCRYLDPEGKSDPPVAAVCVICGALRIPVSRIVPAYFLCCRASKVRVSSYYNGILKLQVLNDRIVSRLQRYIEERYESLYKFSQSYGVTVTQTGLDYAFRARNGHYPMMRVTTALAIMEGLDLDPNTLFCD